MKFERGGFALGLVVGLLVGLSLALGVALYITKAPMPFVNKVPPRTAEQDSAEAERNKRWDPNAPLAGRTGPRAPAAGVAPGDPGATSAIAPRSARDPAAILAGAAPASAPALPKSTTTGTDPFTYFVQIGAFTNAEDAEQQRARLAMLGLEARLSEREQAGKTMYRVRIGPFDRKDDAEATKEKLSGAGVEAALVRVQK